MRLPRITLAVAFFLSSELQFPLMFAQGIAPRRSDSVLYTVRPHRLRRKSLLSRTIFIISKCLVYYKVHSAPQVKYESAIGPHCNRGPTAGVHRRLWQLESV